MNIENYDRELKKLIHELCLIPAPSGMEDRRADFCKKWLCDIGAEGVYIDEAKNVVYPMNCTGNELTVIMAHTDTVFPDTEPMPYYEDEENIYCPGVGDDTAGVAILLMSIKYLIDNKIVPGRGILFVLNSCEEGLGNLKGSRQIMKDFEGRIKEFYTYDGRFDAVVNKSVGSHRYKVTVKTKGGHSFGDFGNQSAIACLAEIINKIYQIEVPGEGKTTYNVGVISGGTSVNTIAQEASMLCEYRSDNESSLSLMEEKFNTIFNESESKDSKVIFERIGERPCMKGVDAVKLEKMTALCQSIQAKHSGLEVKVKSGSTDCNIPHSLGVPAVCAGVVLGGGEHTREEWIKKDSLILGLEISIDLITNLQEADEK